MEGTQINAYLLVDGFGGMYVMEEHLWTEEDGEQVTPGQETLPDFLEEETEVSLAIA